MNVDDVEAPEITGDRLWMIWERQTSLMNKYHQIEFANGVGHAIVAGVDFNLDDPRWQALIKDMFWRAVEEIGESTEAYFDHADVPIHAQEECADALHFLVETMILCGMKPEETLLKVGLNSWVEDAQVDLLDVLCDHGYGGLEKFFDGGITERAYYVVEALAMAANCLKNKPWKNTHVATDKQRVYAHLSLALPALIGYAEAIGMDRDDVFNLYFRKSEVNKFRQRSNY